MDTSWGHPNRTHNERNQTCDCWGHLKAVVRPYWGHLGPILGDLESIFGPSWSRHGAIIIEAIKSQHKTTCCLIFRAGLCPWLAVVSPSWGHPIHIKPIENKYQTTAVLSVGPSWGHLGTTWVPFRGHLGATLSPSLVIFKLRSGHLGPTVRPSKSTPSDTTNKQHVVCFFGPMWGHIGPCWGNIGPGVSHLVDTWGQQNQCKQAQTKKQHVV